MTPTIYRAEIWVDEIAWFGSETNTNVFVAFADPTGGPQILYREPPIAPVSGKTVPTVVGKRVTLIANPAGAAEYKWTIEGPTVSDFVQSGSSGGPVFDFPKTNRIVNFAWWKPSTNTVTLDVTIGPMTITTKCIFVVAEPLVSLTTTVGAVTVDENHEEALGLTSLHFGDAGLNVGVRFQHTGNAPGANIGSLIWVQIANSGVSKLKKSGNAWKMSASGLDKTFPYSDLNSTSDSPAVLGYDEESGLAESLGGAYDEVEVNDSYTMYLMYQPYSIGNDSVWVPIKQVDWGWNARAVRGESGWGFPLVPTISVPPAIRATGWPSWTKSAQDATWQPD
ncbi:MAG: hypothetical protein RLZZ265_210 [Verrucomicrobiota bacterium]